MRVLYRGGWLACPADVNALLKLILRSRAEKRSIERIEMTLSEDLHFSEVLKPEYWREWHRERKLFGIECDIVNE